MQVQEEKREVAKEAPVLVSRWANRFIWAAIVQGLFAVILTIPFVLPSITPSVAMVIANGSAGTWVLVGYVMFIMVGVIASGLTALFYHHLEVELRRPYHGLPSALAWVHLLLMNVGAAAATWSLMYAGYIGEKGLMPTNVGGLAMTAAQVHEMLVQWVNPIGAMLIVTAIGVLAGGLGFLLSYRGAGRRVAATIDTGYESSSEPPLAQRS